MIFFGVLRIEKKSNILQQKKDMMEYDKTIIESDNSELKKYNEQGATKSIPNKKNKKINTGAFVGIGVGAAAAGAVASASMPHFTFGRENGNPVTVNPAPMEDQETQSNNIETSQNADSVVGADSPDASDLPIATSVTDDMTPAEAFAAARQEVGAGGIYYYHGQAQGTYYESEWNNLSDEEKEDYWASVHHTHTHHQQSQHQGAVDQHDFSDVVWADDESGIYIVDVNDNDIPDVVLDLDDNGVGDVLMVDVEIENGEVISIGDVYVGEYLVNTEDVNGDNDYAYNDDDVSDDYSHLLSDLDDHSGLANNDYDYSANTDLDPFIEIDNNIDVSDMI